MRTPNLNDTDRYGSEPTAAELDAIDAEWPALEAELDLVAIEARILTADGGPSPLDWRRLRRAEHRVLTARHAVYGTPAPAAFTESPAVASSVPVSA